MGRKLELYRFRDGITPLSSAEFNFRFFDIDARLFDLEEVKISWENAVSILTNQGIKRIDEVLGPALVYVNETMVDIEEQINQAKMDVAGFISEAQSDITGFVNQAQGEIDAFIFSAGQEWMGIKAGYDLQMTEIQTQFNELLEDWDDIEEAWLIILGQSSGWEAAKNAVDAATNLDSSDTLMKRDTSGRARVADPEDDNDIVNKSYLDTAILAHINDFNPHPGVGSTQDLIYTNGDLTRIDESVDGVLRRRSTLTYTNGVLTSVNVKVYASDGETITSQYTDTLTYSNGILELVERSYS